MSHMMVVRPGTSKRSPCRQECHLPSSRFSHPPSFRLPMASFPSSLLTSRLTVILPHLSMPRTMVDTPGRVHCPRPLHGVSSVLQPCASAGQLIYQFTLVPTTNPTTAPNHP